ncbi:MAG TPA: peptidoglycan-binding protein [Solirubrobacterales bacterium]|nr:peptidoglycan-binding protein [Solirubrobacterales bacterium]
MPNGDQPTIKLGAKGDAVKRAQRALHRTPNPEVATDGIFGPATQQAVKDFQSASPPLAADGVVGPATWAALPDGGPMPVLKQGSELDAVRPLQELLSGAGNTDLWDTGPGEIDGKFGPQTRASVESFQGWARIKVDGIVGDPTWQVQLGPIAYDLESGVGLQYIAG